MNGSASRTATNRWHPKIILSLKHYSFRHFISDLIAGLTVGLVALPLAMAFGIASGVTPEAGIYTAVVAGPTGAFVVIVAGIITTFGLSGLLNLGCVTYTSPEQDQHQNRKEEDS